MFQLLDHPQASTAELQTEVESSTYTLMCRGRTYEVTKPAAALSLDEINARLGQRLFYRGTTYEIVPATPTVEQESETIWKLCYRGVTYWRSKKSAPKQFDYAVV
jgi:Domain of unknown function (DUF4278)